MYQLQKSVFVFPYECKKEIESVAGFFGIDEHVFYLESKIHDIELDLKNLFGLN